jgi:hypothetical protein
VTNCSKGVAKWMHTIIEPTELKFPEALQVRTPTSVINNNERNTYLGTIVIRPE